MPSQSLGPSGSSLIQWPSDRVQVVKISTSWPLLRNARAAVCSEDSAPPTKSVPKRNATKATRSEEDTETRRHGDTEREALSPCLPVSSFSLSTRWICRTRSSASSGMNVKPALATVSGRAAARATTTGTPHAMASRTGIQKPSCTEGMTNTSADR